MLDSALGLVYNMCEWGNTLPVYVKIPADLSSTGKAKWKWEEIDSCIADLVGALQQGGIDMRGSCCGHGKYFGDIHLQDGRILVIADSLFLVNRWRWAWKAVWEAIRLEIKYWKQFVREPLLFYRIYLRRDD